MKNLEPVLILLKAIILRTGSELVDAMRLLLKVVP